MQRKQALLKSGKSRLGGIRVAKRSGEGMLGSSMKTTTTLATVTTADGSRLALLEHDGDYFLRVDGVQLMSTTATASEQLMGELACSEVRGRKGARILIGGLGFGFTLRRVLELAPEDTTVVVAELLPEIVEWNRLHLASVNGCFLDDPRVELRVADVADVLGSAEGDRRFDVILLDVDNGPDALVAKGNRGLYARRGLVAVRSALVRKGTAVFWSANRDRAFVDNLQRAGFAVTEIAAKAYPQARKPTHTLFVAKRKAG